jgi:glutamate dehydrogenase
MAYAKLALNGDLLATSVPDDPYLSRELMRYFPKKMQEQFAAEIEGHRLRREIIVTLLANSMINRGGPSFVSRLMEETGASPATVAAAFAVARDSFGFTELNALIDDLDNRIPGSLQLQLYHAAQKDLTWATIWYIRHEILDKGLDNLVERYRAGISAIENALTDVIGEEARTQFLAECKALEAAGVPATTARRLAAGPYLQRAPDIVHIATGTGAAAPAVARILYASAGALRINRLLSEVSKMFAHDYVERRAINRLLGQLFQTHRSIVANVAKNVDSWESWVDSRRPVVEKTVAAIDQLLAERKFDLARLAVAQGTLADLALH